ncbi:MAG: hypothetical protein OEX23_13735 [Betaproteobacteria bacterium]|nr:hypothetical protein [Betaproteobacteria bacterium]
MASTPKERLQRVLGLPASGRGLSPAAKTALLFAGLALVVAAVAWLDPRPSLRHVRATMLSGSPTGNYFATVDRLADEVSRRKGRLANVATAGSVENIRRLSEARTKCDAHFALMQDGIDWPDKHGLELIGRLPRDESLVILGRNADRIASIGDLKGLRLGVGPEGSGTEHLMRRVLAPLAALDFRVSSQPIDRQLDMLEKGELDLGAMVIDADAKLLADAVRNRNLQILDLPDVASLARRLPFARVGRIEAGQIDYVRRLPAQAKQVLTVQTLIVGNGCASHSATQGMMSAVSELFPTFVRHNRGEPNLTGLPLDTVAKSFFDEEGPDLVGQHAPWVVDILPTATWVKLALVISVLFSGMAVLHRFRLWRIDANRVRVERDIPALFGEGTTVGDIEAMDAAERHRNPDARAKLDAVIARLVELSERCRKQSLSVLVPMGEEMAYRYQETLIADTLHALRAYRDRIA